MLFRRINRTGPEKVFMVFKNSYSTASFTNGQAAMHDYVTDVDGVGVTKPAAISTVHNGSPFAGIAAETIAAGAYGLFQVYGYHAAVRVRTATGGAPAIAKGHPLVMNVAAFCLEGLKFVQQTASSTTKVNMLWTAGFALAAQASWTTKAIAAFIRAL
jgi:hypothetical protein